MKICAVQMASLHDDVPGNLQRHLWWVSHAKALGADLVVFPELSLTGYFPSMARQASMAEGTPLLDTLQAACDAQSIGVAVGLPYSGIQGVRIGMSILRAGQPRLSYAKRRLHEDELHWFVPGNQHVLIDIGGHRVAPAICHESLFLNHAQQAQALGADLYMVSVAKAARGLPKAFEHYADVARRLNLPVIMANTVGPVEDFTAAGRSAAWDAQGQLLVALDEAQEGLVLLDTVTGEAQAVVMASLAA